MGKNVLILTLVILGLLGITITFYFLLAENLKGDKVQIEERSEQVKTPLDRETFIYPVFVDEDGSMFFVGKVKKVLENYLSITSPEDKTEIAFFIPNEVLVFRINSEIAKNSQFAQPEASSSLRIDQPVRVDIDTNVDWKSFDKKRPLPAVKITILE